MTHSQSCLETFFLDKQLTRAAFTGKRPFIETCRHQGFIATEVYECPDPEWADQLSSPNWSSRWHRIRVSPGSSVITSSANFPYCHIRLAMDGLNNSRQRSASYSAWHKAFQATGDVAVRRLDTSSAIPRSEV